MGVNKAIENVKTIISDTLVGEDVTDQGNIDNKLIELDGTDNKNNLSLILRCTQGKISLITSRNEKNGNIETVTT